MLEKVVASLLMQAAKAVSPDIRNLLLRLCKNVLVNAEKTDNPWDDILSVMLIEIIRGPGEGEVSDVALDNVVARLLMLAMKSVSPAIRSLLIKLCQGVVGKAESTDNPWDDILAVMLINIVSGPAD